MRKSELLSLPVSVRSWIILRTHFQEFGDPEVLYKIIDDYYFELPLYEVYLLYAKLIEVVDDKTFQEALDFLFGKDIIISAH